MKLQLLQLSVAAPMDSNECINGDCVGLWGWLMLQESEIGGGGVGEGVLVLSQTNCPLLFTTVGIDYCWSIKEISFC